MKINENKFGGRVIASGGFGCVFSPSLKCKGKRREKNKISKVMTKKHAIAEYNEIINIRKKLNKIPNYSNFFLVDNFDICELEKIPSRDLENFKKKCSALPKDDIDKNSINDSLNKIMALNMPNGGIPVDDYIYDNGSFEKLISLNKSLINLLNNGIIPMNRHNIYHSDIKDSNILVKNNNDKIETKLIDWGLSVEYIPNIEQKFPKPWRNRPLQLNIPFSVIIFTDTFVEKYTKYINDGGKTTYESLKPFVIDYFYMWIKKRGAGHYKFINSIMFMLFSNELQNIDKDVKIKMVETQYTIITIVNYIVDVLIHFTKFRKNGTLNLRYYLDNVFIKNIDIWGFIMSYYTIIELLYNNYKNLNKQQMLIFNHLKNIIINYCYKSSTKPININELSKDLQTLSFLLESEIKINNTSKTSIKSMKTTKKKGITGRTFVPYSNNSKTSKLFFTKSKKSNTKKIKNLILLQKNKK